MFQKAPHPRTNNEHMSIQETLSQHEASEHELIEMEKSIEVMDKYKKDNQFILHALEER
jgi:hypothetical protein